MQHTFIRLETLVILYSIPYFAVDYFLCTLFTIYDKIYCELCAFDLQLLSISGTSLNEFLICAKDLESFLLTMKPSTTSDNRLHAAKCQRRFKDDDDIVSEQRRTNKVSLCSSLNVDSIIKTVTQQKFSKQCKAFLLFPLNQQRILIHKLR